MKNNERIIKTLTVAAVIFIVMLFCALTINLIKYATVSAKEKELNKKVALLHEQIDENDDELEYKLSADYIKKVAREVHNLKNRGERIFRDE